MLTKEEIALAKKIFPHTDPWDDPELDFDRPDAHFLLYDGVTKEELNRFGKMPDHEEAMRWFQERRAAHADEVKELHRKYDYLKDWWKEVPEEER